MAALFTFIHLSDFHICVEPRRINMLSLTTRRPRLTIDTCIAQMQSLGFLSFAKPASYSPQVISGAAQFCHANKNVTDAIIITGDLSTTGDMLDIIPAKEYVMATAASGFTSAINKPTLQSASLPIWVIPGNHDKYADNIATPKSRNFELTFSQLMPNFRNCVSHKVRKKGGKYLGIVFADFCLRQRADASNKISGPFGQGRVYDEVLHELEDRTRDLRRRYQGIKIVWAIHFAPYDCGSALELLDWRLVSQSARSHNIVAILCGHTHVASSLKSDGLIVYCAGSAGAIDQEFCSSVHLVDIEIDPEIRIQRRNYKWNITQDEFKYHNTD